MATDPLNGLELRDGHEQYDVHPFPLNGDGKTYLMPQSPPAVVNDDRLQALCDAVDDFEDGMDNSKDARVKMSAVIRAALNVVYVDAPDMTITRAKWRKAFDYIAVGLIEGES